MHTSASLDRFPAGRKIMFYVRPFLIVGPSARPPSGPLALRDGPSSAQYFQQPFLQLPSLSSSSSSSQSSSSSWRHKSAIPGTGHGTTVANLPSRAHSGGNQSQRPISLRTSVTLSPAQKVSDRLRIGVFLRTFLMNNAETYQ